jgi:hypothetical protein
MSKTVGYETAVRAAVEKLQAVNLDIRCPQLGLNKPQNNIVALRAFGTDMNLHLPDFQLYLKDIQTPAAVSDRILILHYILCDLPIRQTNDLITFRQMDSGIFYWEAFLSRSVRPLAVKIGNNLDQLKANLGRFDWQDFPLGDLGARIHAVGKVYVTLVYHRGDDEFPPSADLLFDANIKNIYPTEDVAVLAGRICLALL